MPLSKQRQSEFLIDFLCGSFSGIVTGIFVSPPEYLKVVLGTPPYPKLRAALKHKETYKGMVRSIVPFSFIFGWVCALEFSVKERIQKSYGNTCGIIASALSGANFLTLADHLMLRRKEKGEFALHALKELYKIRLTALWTGFTPMIAREAMFVTSVTHLGPLLGRKLGGDSQRSSENIILWNSIGRLITGVLSTFISQPFDSLARQLQIRLCENPSTKPTILYCIKQSHQEFVHNLNNHSRIHHPLFGGALPRMGLATFGGVLAGGFFDYFKNNISQILKRTTSD